VNNYLIMDERQEEARRLAANATPTVILQNFSI
jgi:hypothetical protein